MEVPKFVLLSTDEFLGMLEIADRAPKSRLEQLSINAVVENSVNNPSRRNAVSIALAALSKMENASTEGSDSDNDDQGDLRQSPPDQNKEK